MKRFLILCLVFLGTLQATIKSTAHTQQKKSSISSGDADINKFIKDMMRAVLDQLIKEVKGWLFKELNVKIGVLQSELKVTKLQVVTLQRTLHQLKASVESRLAALSARMQRLRADKWRLGMNLNPADGHVMGYAEGWSTGQDIGNFSHALVADYLSARVWSAPANYIAIVRHQAGEMDAVKVWKFNKPGRSMLARFQEMYPGREVATSGGPIQTYLDPAAAPRIEEAGEDPVFGVGGDLALNWWYAENGCRVALTGGHLSGREDDDDNTHGLGNNYAINGRTAQSDGHNTWEWQHEIANIQDCPQWTCNRVQVQGSDHGYGHKLISTPPLGQYAIYVSETASKFPTKTKALEVIMDHDSS